MSHQFEMFGFQKPTGKVPMKKQTIIEAKAFFQNGDQKASAAKMREIREALENYCDRIK
jgi:hypothetical protein